MKAPASPTKGNPIPTRYRADEKKFITRIAAGTGLSESEVIRRAVRFLKRSVRAPVDYHIVFRLTH